VALLIGANIACVGGISVLVGASAPRWPSRWLNSTRGPLRIPLPGEEQLGRWASTGRWGKRLPELGAMFGGASKSALPGKDLSSLTTYAVEVRRAEWVHLISMFTFVPMVLVNPWWLTLLFGVIAIGLNLPFVIVLRHNRNRLERMIARYSTES